jgi:hypothetical protein
MNKKRRIQEMVATKPIYTSNSIIPHPLVKIERKADVARVNGKPTAIFLEKDYNLN